MDNPEMEQGVYPEVEEKGKILKMTIHCSDTETKPFHKRLMCVACRAMQIVRTEINNRADKREVRYSCSVCNNTLKLAHHPSPVQKGWHIR